MASKELLDAVKSYEQYEKENGASLELSIAYRRAAELAYTEKERALGIELSTKAKEICSRAIYEATGADYWELEKWCFENGNPKVDLLEEYYEILLLEAKNMIVDSAFQYLEKKRIPNERFYMPRRKCFLRIGFTQALQGMIDDEYDILCISMPPGSGKTTAEKMFHALVAGWYPRDFSLFYSHSGDITRMYYDGVCDIISNVDEYTWGDIFPNLGVTYTNAKLEQLNIGKYKPFPSVQCTSVGAKNAGKVRVSKNGYLLIDDMIGGFEEAVNINYLDKLWNKYSVDARQRKLDGAKEIVIATRWSVHDVIGRIIRAYEGSSRVKVISVPDINEETGQSNFNYEFNGFSVKFFEDIRKTMDDVSYKCLYKQQPIEREGLVFPEEKLRRYISLPNREPDEIIGQCDTKGKGTDYMVMPILYRYGDDYYCEDCVCSNASDYETQYESLANTIIRNRTQSVDFERNSGGDRVAIEVSKRVVDKGWICNITDTPTETNKEAKIYQCSNWIMQHILFKDKTSYTAKDDYGTMMALLVSYSVSNKKQLDDVPDVFSTFALRVTGVKKQNTAQAIMNPFRRY